MIWLAVLLTASLAAPSAASGDGQPPVTIIEIPLATTTTTVSATSVVPPETSVLTTSPTPATSSLQIEDQVSPTVGWPLGWAVLVLVVWVLFVLALVHARRSMLPGDGAVSATPVSRPPSAVSPLALRLEEAEHRSEPGTPSDIPVPPLPAPPPLALGQYEAVEYRSESGTSEVEPRTLGQFETLQAAIDAARLARSSFVLDSGTEAFWVVWNRHLNRAAWIAESGTPGESVIDLRTGRRQPYIAESTKA